MKEAQKMIIIGLLVLALLPGFIGVASAAPKIRGTCYVDDGSHSNIEKTYSYRNLPSCSIQICVAGTDNCKLVTGNRQGAYGGTIGLKTFSVVAVPPKGWTAYPSDGYSVTGASGDVTEGVDFWFTPLTPPSVDSVTIPGIIEPGGFVQGTVTVTAGSEQIDYAKLKYSGDHNRFQVVASKVTIPPYASQDIQVTINGAPILKPGDYSFNIDVWDMNYLPDGTDRLVMSIPVTMTVPVEP